MLKHSGFEYSEGGVGERFTDKFASLLVSPFIDQRQSAPSILGRDHR
jgi:hypothetical protein